MKLYDFYRGKKGSITENIQSASEVEKQYIEENLHKWFKEKWVRFGPDGKIRGDCARGDDSEGKPKCLPRAKAHALGKKGRKYAAAKKRREDPNPERSGAAINVATKKKMAEDYEMNPNSNVPQYKTWGDAAKAWSDARKSDSMVNKAINFIPGVRQAASVLDTGAAAIQGDLKGAARQTLGMIPGAKVINTALQAKDVAGNLLSGNVAAAGMGALNIAAGQGNKTANDVRRAIKVATNAPKVLDAIGVSTGNEQTPQQDTNVNEVTDAQKDHTMKVYKCPHCGEKMVSEEFINEKKDACYYKVKGRYKVWPSAYASGALVKCRKKGAKNWGTKSESQHSVSEQQTVVPKRGPKGETVVAPVLPAEQEDFEKMMSAARANTEANRENTVLAQRGDPQAYRAADSSSAPASGASQSRSIRSASVDPSKARLTPQDLGDDEKWERDVQKIPFPNTTRSSGTVRPATAQEITRATAAGLIPPTTTRPTATATTATEPAASAATPAPSRPATPAVPSSQSFAQAFAAARANARGPGGVFSWTDAKGVTRQYQTNISGEKYLPPSQLKPVLTTRQATRESSTNMYFNVSGTDRKTLIQEFKMQHDNRGWFLGESATAARKLDAIRAFGMPLTEEEMNQAAYSGTAATLGVDNPKSPIGSISKSQRLNKRSRSK